MRIRQAISVLLSLALALLMSACGAPAEEPGPEEASSPGAGPEVVELTVWGAEEDMGLLQEITDAFKARYADEARFRITLEPQSESSCKDALLADLENGPDVFAFADDQVAALAAAGALEPIEDADAVRRENLSAAVEAASVDGVPYAYPLTADNGYFLYYDKAFLSEEDVRTLDGILTKATELGKVFAMDWTSGWYVYAFFGNTGMLVGLNDDGITNYCTWNSREGDVTGVEVAQAMLAIAASPAFSSMNDEEFLAGVRDGSVIAGVSGVWNDAALREAWGDDLGAVKLPTYTVDGRQVQMASFSGCKLMGANAYSEHPEWASRLAQWIANEQNQTLRFEERGQGPANIRAASSPEVQQSPAIAALLAQTEFSQLQRVGGKFWDPVTEFATSMAQGNPSGADLQTQLDRMVEGVTAR